MHNVQRLNHLPGLLSIYLGLPWDSDDGARLMIDILPLMHISAPTIQIGILDVDLTRLIPGILIISMNSGAYVSETVRAGINAVPKGQLEAAYSLGIRPKNAMRYVILPQAIKNILPSLGNEVYHYYQG